MSDNGNAATLLDASPATEVFLRDVLAGLSARKKTLRSKYFYDERGSRLFEQICELDEYYLTRAELHIMEQYATEMAEVIGPRTRLLEYGSGASIKTRLLLDALIEPAACVLVDISGNHLQDVAVELADDHPEVPILPVCADFTRPFDVPTPSTPFDHTTVYFPGSTIGNFLPDFSLKLLKQMAEHSRPHGGLLIGIDLQKDIDVIHAAYNDAQGVTAEFNLNMLRRVNADLDADFDLDAFEHRAPYNETAHRVEMHLVSQQDQTVNVAGRSIHFKRGESICTEHSHKYTIDGFARMAAEAGFEIRKVWQDDRKYFAVIFFCQMRTSPRKD